MSKYFSYNAGFLLLIFFMGCSQKREYPKYIPTPKTNPWEYINPISDTLPETGFSLFNSREENLKIFKEDEIEKMFRYRIAQGKQIPVIAFNVDPKGMTFCYNNSNHFDLMILENGDFLFHDNSGNISNFRIDSLFYSFLKEKIGSKLPRFPKGLFSIKFRKLADQKIIIKYIDQLAYGYIIYLDWYSLENFKLKFAELTISEQNKILKSIPFALDYNIDRLYSKPPEMPIVILK